MDQEPAIETRRAHITRWRRPTWLRCAATAAEYLEDQFWLDVRRTLLFCLAYPVHTMALDLTERARPRSIMKWPIARRRDPRTRRVGTLAPL